MREKLKEWWQRFKSSPLMATVLPAVFFFGTFGTETGTESRKAIQDVLGGLRDEIEVWLDRSKIYVVFLAAFSLIGLIFLISQIPTVGMVILFLAWLPAILAALVIGSLVNGLSGANKRILKNAIRPLVVIVFLVVSALTLTYFFHSGHDWGLLALLLLIFGVFLMTSLCSILLGSQRNTLYVLITIFGLVAPLAYFAFFSGTDLEQALFNARVSSINFFAHTTDRKALGYQTGGQNLWIPSRELALYEIKRDKQEIKFSATSESVAPADTLLVVNARGIRPQTSEGIATGENFIAIIRKDAGGAYQGNTYYVPLRMGRIVSAKEIEIKPEIRLETQAQDTSSSQKQEVAPGQRSRALTETRPAKPRDLTPKRDSRTRPPGGEVIED